MATQTSGNRSSYAYVGLAGETAPGRQVNSGLYRMAAGGDRWELTTNGLPESPAIRALAVHPQKPEIVYAGTQEGPYRSTDHGGHWEKVNVPGPDLPVWSILYDSRDSNVMYAGYEACQIYRSEDSGDNWRQMPVSVRFPEIALGPGSNPAKRVLMMSASTADPNELYAAIEVGGLIRTMDGGDHWENLSHGQYVNDDEVDMHGVLASTLRPGAVFGIGRAGLFSSTDHGEHWSYITLGPMNPKGQTYCRCIRENPGDPRNIWVAAGGNFQSERGVLFRSKDGGLNWEQADMGVEPKSTMFSVAMDSNEPSRMWCAANGGEAWTSGDSGDTWTAHPLPEGATQVYSLACG
ncbi:MAG: hypothetical protein BZY88_13525 [SAR202 cluster bacterium Io17-Chloro-G9]|nr:MAG: hypothetical protein BZY88_13525 [SAR202 cluster bacterium Io17-Chloro-G9]